MIRRGGSNHKINDFEDSRITKESHQQFDKLAQD
jgi:hypothetical protein